MDFPLLAGLPEEARAALLSSVRRRVFGRGEVVVREGDPADSLHLVRRGRLGVRVTTPGGESAMLNIVGPGGYFGELSLLEGEHRPRTATVLALEPSETWSLRAAAFHDVRRQHPEVQEVVVAALARRVEDLSGRLLEMLFESLDRRVYRLLVRLVDVYATGDEQPQEVVVPLTQETLAEFVGGTRPSVNQVLQRLAEQGTVGLGRGRVVVLDAEALRTRVSGP